MASSTRNVKLGVCQVIFGGVDLGYTQGGVEVTVETETHEVNIDQFGKTAINELIMGRNVKAKVPLAETTLENMVQIMPNATLVVTGGTAATTSLTIGTNPTTGQTYTVNGATITFKTGTANASNNEVLIGAAATNTGDNLRTFFGTSVTNGITNGTTEDPRLKDIVAGGSGATVTLTAVTKGTAGNSLYVSAASGDTATGITPANTKTFFTTGAEPTAKRVDVAVGTNTDLLAIAKELRLHPTNKALTDRSDDFVIPLAATAGALNFAYKLENERVYNIEFNGYPDPTTQRLFYVGDKNAT